MTPKRIQRKRTKGWRMPPNAVYVGKPTKWGNPFLLADYEPQEAVERFRYYIGHQNSPLGFEPADLDELRGKDLVCWCAPDAPCHADVLIDLANRD